MQKLCVDRNKESDPMMQRLCSVIAFTRWVAINSMILVHGVTWRQNLFPGVQKLRM